MNEEEAKTIARETICSSCKGTRCGWCDLENICEEFAKEVEKIIIEDS